MANDQIYFKRETEFQLATCKHMKQEEAIYIFNYFLRYNIFNYLVRNNIYFQLFCNPFTEGARENSN